MSDALDALRGKTVLLLEDNFVVALALQDQLSDFGLTVVGPFASVARASEHSARSPVDFAVLDVQVRDGVSFGYAATLVRAGTRCVFVTGYSVLPDCPSELAQVPRLMKPIAPRVLAEHLRALWKDDARGG